MKGGGERLANKRTKQVWQKQNKKSNVAVLKLNYYYFLSLSLFYVFPLLFDTMCLWWMQ